MLQYWGNSYGFNSLVPSTVSDADARAYIDLVGAADGNQALEQGVQNAIDTFVVGCKSDGTWTAIKASCILAGARTLAGALVPLVGTAPTNNNFASGDYNRKTGLLGNGSSKYLNSNRANNADPQNSRHLASYVSTIVSGPLMGTSTYTTNGWSGIYYDGINNYYNPGLNTGSGVFGSTAGVVLAGFNGTSRNTSSQVTNRRNGASSMGTSNSFTPVADNITVFTGVLGFASSRIAFYSIGEFLDLAKLDTRVTALIAAINATI